MASFISERILRRAGGSIAESADTAEVDVARLCLKYGKHRPIERTFDRGLYRSIDADIVRIPKFRYDYGLS